MKRLILLLFIFFTNALVFSTPTLRGKLEQGEPGDYIVVSQGGYYSVFLLRDRNEHHFILEEISIDRSQIDLKKINWKEWVEGKAPGATTWTSFIIDREKNTLTQCYSYTEKQWLLIEKSDYFTKQLLTLALRPTKENERKRVGPPPMAGEIDRRKLWKPQKVFEGKKTKNPEYEVLRAKWPSDQSLLADCTLELYLDVAQPNFPFPYWLEIQSPHYTFKLITLDSGKAIRSPMRSLR